MKAPEKDNTEKKSEINNENNKLSSENIIPQNQNKNIIQKENKNSSNSLNAQNSSSNSMNNENQSQPQNQNILPTNFLSNFPPKEYFNFSFFKRQMSSRSSDIDYYQDNKEGINEFFNTKCKSIYSKDSEKQNNSKKSSELNSFELNLGNKDENNQVSLIRANSARTKNCRSNNYIPKTVFFQRNNSNNPSCFYKKHKIEKHEIKNNNIENNDKNKNLVLQYYGDNNEFKNKNNLLELVNDKYDEAEEEDEEKSEEDEEEDEDDECILTKKNNQNFTVNYLSGSGGINKPKSTFTLLHRGTSNIKLDKEKKEEDKESEKEKSKDKIDDIDILNINKDKLENNEKNNDIELNKEKINNDNINILNPLKNDENENDYEKNNENENNKGIINENLLNNNINEQEIFNNITKNEDIINNNIDLINKNQRQYQNNYNLYTYQQNNYSLLKNESIFKNMTNLNLIYNNNIKNNGTISQKETEEFLKNVLNHIKDQQGCRLIQRKISENPEISNTLFDILYKNIITMSKDLFGNYVIQKILENVKPNYLVKFIELISQDFNNLSISIYGTRVVQKILEIVSKPRYTSDKEIYEQCFQTINNYITKNIVELSSNNNSSHIIIKYVNEIKYPQNDLLYKEVYNNFVPLCKNKHGCCVIQKCIDFGTDEQKNKLLELSNLNCENLISDQFGNYVIQFVLGLNINIINEKVYEILYKNLIPLCKEKYASNVIEKFLINKSKESIDIINILLNNEKYLHELIIDQFGNYIIQRILLLIEGESRTNLINYIVKWYPEIKSLSFGPRLISKLHERFQEFTLLVTQKYGWETAQETSAFIYGKPNLNLRNNFIPNKTINNMNYMRNMNIMNNLGNRMNGINNNNYMNFQNKNNVGNINFIQLNNYMLTNGQNNIRFPMNGFGGFNNFNNLNNGQFFTNFGNVNYIPNNINNNIKPNINAPINIQRINLNDEPNINNYFLNNNQNMMNYNQYLKATFSNNKNN